MRDVVDQLPRHSTKRYSTRPLSDVRQIVVHHSATPVTITPAQIARYHVGTRGWPGIGYHFCVTSGGHIYKTNRLETFSYHAKDANGYSVGVCLIGNFTDHPPTLLQLAGAQETIEYIQEKLGRRLEVVGHKEAEGASTTCPGDTWEEWRKQIVLATEKEEKPMTTRLGIATQTEPERSRNPDHPQLADIIADSPIRYAKAINPTSWPEGLDTMWPNVEKGWARFWIGGDGKEHALMQKGAAGAVEYYDMLAERYERALEMGWTEFTGPNEPHPALWDDPTTFNSFFKRWVPFVSSLGAHPWVGEFGNGWPRIDHLSLYAESIALAAENGGGLEDHEYGFPAIRSGEPWMFGRHAKVQAKLQELGMDEVPIIIGEVGVTRAVRGGPDIGWKSMSSWVYPPMFGLPQSTMTKELWWRMMSDADDAYMEYPWIVAVFPFLSWPRPEWSTHDWGEWHIRKQIAKAETTAEPSLAQIREEISIKAQQHVIPYNENAALWRAAQERGLTVVRTEEQRDVAGIVYQIFSRPGESGQTALWVYDGEWGNVHEHTIEDER